MGGLRTKFILTSFSYPLLAVIIWGENCFLPKSGGPPRGPGPGPKRPGPRGPVSQTASGPEVGSQFRGRASQGPADKPQCSRLTKVWELVMWSEPKAEINQSSGSLVFIVESLSARGWDKILHCLDWCETIYWHNNLSETENLWFFTDFFCEV